MSKKEIPFDFSKWGKNGISVEFASIPEKTKVLTLHQHPGHTRTYYGILDEIGTIFMEHQNRFTMYEDIEESWTIGGRKMEDMSKGELIHHLKKALKESPMVFIQEPKSKS